MEADARSSKLPQSLAAYHPVSLWTCIGFQSIEPRYRPQILWAVPLPKLQPPLKSSPLHKSAFISNPCARVSPTSQTFDFFFGLFEMRAYWLCHLPIPCPPACNKSQTIVETEEEEEQRAAREWQDDGRKGRVLVRRKEIPSPAMDPASVCQLVFESLQNNDDPMLDYGAAVAVKFASSKSAVRNMTPAEYGAFLRNDPDQVLLVDNASCAPAERAKVSADGKQVLQKVEVVGRYPDVVRRIVEVQLTKEEDDCWRVDAMTLGPNVEQRK
ncbi:unnamed protein product [Ectocarpus sp. 4 AP-2014]